MGFLKDDLKWITELSVDLSADENNIKFAIEKIYSKRLANYHNDIFTNKDNNSFIFITNIRDIFNSKWFVLLNEYRYSDIFKKKISSNCNGFFVQKNSGEYSLVLIEIKKGQKSFYFKEDKCLIFEKRNDFVLLFKLSDSELKKAYFHINKFTNKIIYTKENKEYFMAYSFERKFKVFKNANKNEIFAIEYNLFGKEIGKLLLTEDLFIDYNKESMKDFLIFENYIHIRYKKDSKESLLNINLNNKAFLNANESFQVHLTEIDKKNINDELDLWELNYKY